MIIMKAKMKMGEDIMVREIQNVTSLRAQLSFQNVPSLHTFQNYPLKAALQTGQG